MMRRILDRIGEGNQFFVIVIRGGKRLANKHTGQACGAGTQNRQNSACCYKRDNLALSQPDLSYEHDYWV